MRLDPGPIIAPADLIPIRDLVAETAGLYFEKTKFYFMEKRIFRRMKATNSKTATDYFRLLKLGSNPDEMKELIAILTINETYFFRNIPQLESFAEEALPLVLDNKRQAGDYSLKIWSAACSSGEEPYTLSILLKEYIPDYSKWNIVIYATDINQYVLEKAKVGVYGSRSVKDVTPDILERHFIKASENYQIHPEIKIPVSFKCLNLMDRKSMRLQTEMDFVFCRNVLIYFNNEARKQVVNSIYNNLNPGGFIFLGHSESVGRISAAFKLIKLEKSLSYRK